MSTCGYICPQCEGRGFLESGEVCDWCSVTPPPEQKKNDTISDEEWQRSVHEGKCCGD